MDRPPHNDRLLSDRGGLSPPVASPELRIIPGEGGTARRRLPSSSPPEQPLVCRARPRPRGTAPRNSATRRRSSIRRTIPPRRPRITRTSSPPATRRSSSTRPMLMDPSPTCAKPRRLASRSSAWIVRSTPPMLPISQILSDNYSGLCRPRAVLRQGSRRTGTYVETARARRRQQHLESLERISQRRRPLPWLEDGRPAERGL